MKVYSFDEAYPEHAFVASHEMIQLRVNGAEQSFSGEPEMPLLWYLRDILGLTGSKFGCGVGLCGACTVHVNGQATRSCVTAMRELTLKEVTTVEGLEKNRLHLVQKAWMQINVPQCGYCQAGQIMQAAALLNSKKNPSDQEIDEAMAGNNHCQWQGRNALVQEFAQR
jgi:isoquinoline 1-oxidoreductase alpha subunit